MATLEEIRSRLAAQDNKSTGTKAPYQADNAVYPHWNMDEGTTATIRFLPDADPNNPFFWVERAMLKFPFNGVKGDPSAKQVTVQVPCIEMYPGNEKCPVLAEVRAWYKDESMTELANKYWKKRSYLYQGFVRQNPIGADTTPENPIRRFLITSTIHNGIKASLMDPELQEMPTHFTSGLDFNIRKTTKGGWADYSTSGWARRESALTDVEMAAIEAHGLYNLADFLPKKPTEADLRIIKEMFEASVDGKPYDPERWGAYYRPYGVAAPAGSTASSNNAVAESKQAAPVMSGFTNKPAAAQDTAPWEDDVAAAESAVSVPKAAPAASDKTDILALIRQRQANKS
jgi:hypothetical protein